MNDYWKNAPPEVRGAARKAAEEFVDSVPAGTTLTVESGGKSVTIEGRKRMVGAQTAVNPDTGEIMDEADILKLYTETSISGKQLIKDRMKLGESVTITLVAKTVATGKTLDANGNTVHVQKLALVSVREVEREG